jgi:hypothetical protein
MPFFHQSSLTFAQAKAKIARAASVEADSDMLTKAGDALEAAFQTWNNRRHWNFLRETHTFVTEPAFTVADCTTTINASTITTTNSFTTPKLVRIGDIVSGTSIPVGTSVRAQAASSITVSFPMPATTTQTLTFTRPEYSLSTTHNYIYNVRDLSTNSTVLPMDSRTLDNLVPDQTLQDAPLVYTLHQQGAQGYIRLYPIPITSHYIELKYYRRMTVPNTDGTALDIPIDFEWGVLAEAKAIFLAEKGGYDGLAAFWGTKAADALALAILADKKQPDDEPGFKVGYVHSGFSQPGNTLATTDFDN